MARVAVFDVNETLLDLAALDPLFEELLGDGAARHEWFSQTLQFALTLAAIRRYESFGAAGAAALAVVARERTLSIRSRTSPNSVRVSVRSLRSLTLR